VRIAKGILCSMYLSTHTGASHMKIPITVRIDPDLLHAVRDCAVKENRNLTNFIETALRDRIGTNIELAPHTRPRTVAGSTKGR
jgi:hypothetical protein